jgi:hypothetical protein
MIGDPEHQRPGPLRRRLLQAHIRQPHRQRAARQPVLPDAKLRPEEGDAARRLGADRILHVTQIEQVGTGELHAFSVVFEVGGQIDPASTM